jgi:tripeptidyl-peptidase-1
MAPLLAFLVGSLLAARGLAEPFEKLFTLPEGESCRTSYIYNS